jgi:predicted GIY-YIG superfamily endonuclease
MAVIYQIKNRINGKSYIGVTSKCPPEKRFGEHLRASRGAPTTKLQREVQ